MLAPDELSCLCDVEMWRAFCLMMLPSAMMSHDFLRHAVDGAPPKMMIFMLDICLRCRRQKMPRYRRRAV